MKDKGKVITTVITVLAVLLLQVVAIEVAGYTRGYQAHGGEMLVIPIAVLIYLVKKEVEKENQ